MSSAHSSPQAGARSQNKRPNGKPRNACLDDDYMMFTYKVIPCSRVSTHNWKLCHFSHVGEVAARRRHPSTHQADMCAWVSANKECPLGDKCTFAHNTFESWLHPDRYKSTLCSYAGACTRKFCFFAHSASELRIPNKHNPQLTLDSLMKTTSLDTCSVGTPNSSSSNNSSTFLAQLQPTWTTTGADPAMLSNNGGLFLTNINGSTGYYTAGNTNVVAYNAATGGMQQLPALIVAAPPFPATTGAAALPVTVPSITATAGLTHVSSGVSLWDKTPQLVRVGSTPIGSDSSCHSGSTMFDPTISPQTQSSLAVRSVSPTNSTAPIGSSSGSLHRVTLQSLESAQRQDSSLRQQLLQHLASLQQQSQQQQQIGLDLSNQTWTLGSHDMLNISGRSSSLFGLNSVGVQSSNPMTATLSAAPAATTTAWPPGLSLVSLQAGEQQQQFGTQVTGANSNMAQSSSDQQAGFSTAGFMGADTTQLQQQLNMLSFAMAQPA